MTTGRNDQRERLSSRFGRTAALIFAGGGWALLGSAGYRVGRPLFGPSPVDWAVPFFAFAVAFLLGARIPCVVSLSRFERLWAIVRIRPLFLALIVAFFSSIAGLFPSSSVLPQVIFFLVVLTAGFSLGAMIDMERRGRGEVLTPVLLFGFTGAAAGALAGTHLLLPSFGDRGTALAATVLFLVAIPFAARRGDAEPERSGAPAMEPRSLTGAVPLLIFGLTIPLLLLGWGRLFDLVLGPGLRISGLFAAILLFGTALGAGLAGALFRGRPSPSFLAAGAGLLSAALVATIAVAARLPWFYIEKGGVDVDPSVVFGARLQLLVPLLLPLSILIGLVARLSAARLSAARPGGSTIRSTFPFIAGVVAAFFIAVPILPAAGIRALFTGASALFLLLGIAAIAGAGGGRKVIRVAFAVLFLLGMVVVLFNPPRWKPALLNCGAYQYGRLYRGMPEDEFVTNLGTVPAFYREGSRRSIMVTGLPGARYLTGDGRVESSDGESISVPLMLARFPLMLRPEAKEVLLLGAGGGTTLGTVLRSGVSGVTCVEPEPVRLEAMRHLGGVNHQPWKDDRVRFVRGDPRAALARTSERYDIILCQSVSFWDRAGADRATSDFFHILADRLRDGDGGGGGGVAVYPVPLAGLREDQLKVIVRGFRDAFPHLLGIRAARAEVLLLAGSDTPLRLDASRLLDDWAEVEIRADLLGAGLRSAPEIVSLVRIDGETADRFAGEAVPERDGDGFLEFGTEQRAPELTGARLDARLQALHPDPEGYLGYGTMDRELRVRFDEKVARVFRRTGDGARGLIFARRAYVGEPEGAVASLAGHFLKTEKGDLDSAITVVRGAWEKERENPALIRQLADYYFGARRFEDCDSLLSGVIDGGLRESWCYVVRGKARLGMKEHQAGLDDLIRGKELDRLQDRKGNINYWLAMAYKNLGRLEDSQNMMGRAMRTNPGHVYAHHEFGENKLLMGKIDRNTYESEFLLPFNRARAESLFVQSEKRLYEPEHAREVERDLTAVINTTPNHFGAYLALAEFYRQSGNEGKEGEALTRMLDRFQRSPQAVAMVKEYFRRTGGEERVREWSALLR